MSLQQQIDGINVWRKIRGEKQLSLHSLKQSDVNDIAGNLDCQTHHTGLRNKGRSVPKNRPPQ